MLSGNRRIIRHLRVTTTAITDGSTTTDREQRQLAEKGNHKYSNRRIIRHLRVTTTAITDGSTTTDREQRQLAEKGDHKYIFTIPRAILPKPSFCDEMIGDKITVMKPLVCGQFVAVS